MATLSKLIEINKLAQQKGLWVLDQPTQFNYTDGEGSELFLKRVVSEACDLSSQSIELESCYPDWDWVAEYHLSYKRANLLRGFDLSKIETALEIGCGCGAITRYLGEQGIGVDAIEGAQRRADIAQLRCRDLDNVRIINANYNELKLPEAAYDAIFVVGVIEYAGKFLSGAKSDEAAVVTILKQLQRALTENGVLVIAIENRNGLKYWLGASEDHYGKPFVGLTDYWGQSGTKTYTYKKWQTLLKQAGVAHWHFQFPFPDYKLPRVILDEHFIDTDENAYSLLYRITSRDYLSSWQSGANEFSMWRALHHSGQLKEYANSFLIVAGQDKSCFKELLPADFAYFSGGSRKPEFRTVTFKAYQADQVSKKYLWANEAESRKELTQQASISPYVKGTLLSTIWLETLLASDLDQFQTLLDRYYKFIDQQLADGAGNSMIDALPANIVVDSGNLYHIIDQEWQIDSSLAAEFLLFRSLLWFGRDNQALLDAFFQSNNLNCLRDFVEFGFNALSNNTSSAEMADFASREDAIQFRVSGQKNVRPIHLLLTTPFVLGKVKNASLKIYWAGKDQSFEDTRSSVVYYRIEGRRTSIQCRFAFDQCVSRIRVMPLYHTSEAKLFLLERIALSQCVNCDNDAKLIWQEQLNGNDAPNIQYNYFVLPLSKIKGAFIISDSRATLDFPVTCLHEGDVGNNELFELELNLAGEAYLEPSLVTEHQARQAGAIEQEVGRYQQIIKDQNSLIKENDHARANKLDEALHLKAQLQDANERANTTTAKLSAVKSELNEARQFLERLAQVKFIKSTGRFMPGKYGWLSSGLDRYNRFSSKQSDYDLIKQSGLFDETYYGEYQPDLEPFNGDPLRHYLLLGGFNGLNPNRLFDTPFYLKQCPELVTERLSPLVHYLSVGASEGKNPCYLFDTQYYIDQYPKVIENGSTPLQHYLGNGGKEGLEPHPIFDTNYYYSQRPDAKESSLTPLDHFFLFGEPDQLSPTALFDWDYYLENRPSLVDANISAFRHLIEHGYKEGSDLSPYFDTHYYYYPDLTDLEFKANPIAHYIEKGQYELRSPSPFFDPQYYCSQLAAANEQNLKDPFSHYLAKGEAKGMNPHPLFNTLFYKAQLAKTGIRSDKLLKHFILKGLDGSHMSHPLFEPGYYLAQLPYEDVVASARLLSYYSEENKDYPQNPHPLFDVKYYRSQLDPEDPRHINPLVHYVTKGLSQGLSTHPEFDPRYYTSQDLDPALKEGQSPVAHYIYRGAQKERWPNQVVEQLASKPQISLFLLIDSPDFNYLSGRILAVISQLYPCWRLTVIIRNPDESDDYHYAKDLAVDDSRIQWVETDDTDSAATLLNRALENSTNEYVVFLGEQMYLKAHALLAFVCLLNTNLDATLIHTDRNQNDPNSIPVEQPDDNLNGLSTRYFIGPLACFKRALIDRMGGFATWHQSAHDERFLTHYLHQVPSSSVKHIAEPLHFTMAKDPLHIIVRNK